MALNLGNVLVFADGEQFRLGIKGDVIEHEQGSYCLCGPRAVKVTDNVSGHLGWMHVHFAVSPAADEEEA